MIKTEHDLSNKMYFQWLQLIDSIPTSWKNIIRINQVYTKNLLIFDHHVIKQNRVMTIDKLTAKEIYSLLILEN